jgi:hypothetical protein
MSSQVPASNPASTQRMMSIADMNVVPPNVKHQRARAEVSRGKDELSLRALRCMR